MFYSLTLKKEWAKVRKFIRINGDKGSRQANHHQMILFKEAATLKKYIGKNKESGKKIGFVPTMGALHQGHLSLVESSKGKSDITICSIFVNPTQFNDPKDFEKYPVTIGNDILLLESNGCDVLFFPAVHEIYPAGTSSPIHYNLGSIENLLEGKYRPGHFQGVCQVVHKLLDIVTPDFLFMGQKDYQQVIVVKRLVELIQRPVQVITASTFRETTGLAMSSRNLRLSEEQKQLAAGIYKMLDYIKNNYTAFPVPDLEKHAANYLITHGFAKVDYVAIANAETLQPVTDSRNNEAAVALIAAFVGDIRLIDNMIIAG
ncbi:MAG: pantoate--beta-alanine ligase [Segetibacter sp.]|nr:pantoate--beta-alanine ligase [Segetibacter sp.]